MSVGISFGLGGIGTTGSGNISGLLEVLIVLDESPISIFLDATTTLLMDDLTSESAITLVSDPSVSILLDSPQYTVTLCDDS